MSLRTLHSRFVAAADCLQSMVLFFVRVVCGISLYTSGIGHLTHVQKTAQFFTNLHIPFPVANVYLSGTTELVGGVLLALGLFSRVAAVPLLFNFCIAYLTASTNAVKELLHFSPDDFLSDTAFPFFMASLLVLAFGPGKISLDFLIARFGKKKPASAEGKK